MSPRPVFFRSFFVIILPETTSTQDVAKKLLGDGAAHGTWVLAHKQSAGRGRLGRTWLSPTGGLYASTILRPTLPLPHAPRLSFAAALAVLHTLQRHGAAPVWKWPNDLLLTAKASNALYGSFQKVAGVLLEAVSAGDALVGVVIGIGINVGTVPKEVEDIATCIHADVMSVSSSLQEEMTIATAEVMTADGWQRSLHSLRKHFWGQGKRVRVGTLEGIIHSVHDDGTLFVADESDSLHAIHAGEVILSPSP